MPLSEQQLDEIIENCTDPRCSRLSDGSCWSMHCVYCGEPCSSQGHFNCPVREKEMDMYDMRRDDDVALYREEETRIMTPEENVEIPTIQVEREEYDFLTRQAEKLRRLEEEGNPADIDLVESNSEKMLELNE